MGMSFHIDVVTAADEKWHRMKAAWEACDAAGVAQSEELLDFFDDTAPDPRGVVRSLKVDHHNDQYDECIKDDSSDYNLALSVDIAKVRERYPDATHIRFTVSS